MTARGTCVALGALLAAPLLGGCPGPADDPPRACVTSTDCVLVPASCCGRCRRPTREDAIALSADGADAYRDVVCGDDASCEYCESLGAAPYAVACDDGLCTLRDPEEAASSLRECTIDADCRLRRARCCDCGPYDDVLSPVNELIAVRVDAEEEVRAWLCAPGETCECESPEPYGGGRCYAGRCGSYLSRREVSLLFVVDGSAAMTEEQAALAAAVPTLVRALVSGDLDGDEAPDVAPIAVLNAGVITMDMGTSGEPVPTCARAGFGDDGISRVSTWTPERCDVRRQGVLSFQDLDEPDDLARHLACAVTVGTGGCGIEQPLEAALKALTPSGSPWGASPDFVAVGSSGAPDGLDAPFFMDTTPHGDGENADLAPRASALAVVLLSDDDDCSILDPALFDPAGVDYPGDLLLRCTRYREALHPITRYATGLAQLRDRPNRVVFAPIVGVPLDLVAPPGEPTRWDALVSDDLAVRDDRMEVREEPSEPNVRVASCEDPDRGLAYPPERIAQTARALEARGAHVTIQSICQPRLDGAMTEIARAIGLALR